MSQLEIRDLAPAFGAEVRGLRPRGGARRRGTSRAQGRVRPSWAARVPRTSTSIAPARPSSCRCSPVTATRRKRAWPRPRNARARSGSRTPCPTPPRPSASCCCTPTRCGRSIPTRSSRCTAKTWSLRYRRRGSRARRTRGRRCPPTCALGSRAWKRCTPRASASGATTREKLLQPMRANEQSTTTPVGHRNPRTGTTMLYVSPMMTTEIVGLPEQESEDLLAELFRYIDTPENTVELDWQQRRSRHLGQPRGAARAARRHRRGRGADAAQGRVPVGARFDRQARESEVRIRGDTLSAAGHHGRHTVDACDRV